METLKLAGKGVLVGACALLTYYSGAHALPEILHEIEGLDGSLHRTLSDQLASILGALILAGALATFVIELAIRRGAHRKVVMAISVLFIAVGSSLILLPFQTQSGQIVKVPHTPRHGKRGDKVHGSHKHEAKAKAKLASSSHGTEGSGGSTSGTSGGSNEEEATASGAGASPCSCSAHSSSPPPPTKSPCSCSSPPPSTTRPTPGGSASGEEWEEEPEWEEEWEEEPEWEEEEF